MYRKTSGLLQIPHLWYTGNLYALKNFNMVCELTGLLQIPHLMFFLIVVFYVHHSFFWGIFFRRHPIHSHQHPLRINDCECHKVTNRSTSIVIVVVTGYETKVIRRFLLIKHNKVLLPSILDCLESTIDYRI
jgi:hypothetical protein